MVARGKADVRGDVVDGTVGLGEQLPGEFQAIVAQEGAGAGLRSYYPFSDGCAIQMNRTARAVDSPRMDGMWDGYTFEDGGVDWSKRIGTMLFVS